MRLEKLAEVTDRHVTSAVGTERITLVDRLAVETVQLALITLVQVVVSIVAHQPPGIFGQLVEPNADWTRQTNGCVTQVAQRITLAAHAGFRHFERGLFRGAGAGQTC
ncbi:hypothetical protein D9M71_801480 [compost metagenome]